MIRYISVNAVDLAYAVLGEGSGKPPLVFVHGYAMRSTGDIYRQLFDGLSRSFTVYALDIRGHGASAGADAWSLECIADDAAAFADALGLSRPVYVGHSIGGFIGLLTAIRHPGRFCALALLASAPAIGGGFNPPEVRATLVAHGRDAVRMRGFFGPMYVRPAPDELERAVASLAVVEPQVHEAFFPDFSACVLTGRAPGIDVPVLMLNGAREVVVPPQEQHATAGLLTRCKEVTLSTEGHMLPVEAADLTAREIESFVARDAPFLAAAPV